MNKVCGESFNNFVNLFCQKSLFIANLEGRDTWKKQKMGILAELLKHKKRHLIQTILILPRGNISKK